MEAEKSYIDVVENGSSNGSEQVPIIDREAEKRYESYKKR
jgi:hypothetical protein